MRREWVAVGVTTTSVAALIAACGVSGADRCLPSRLSAAPAEVAVGGVLTISSPAFDCDARYPVGTTYDLSLSVAGRREPVPLGSFAVDEDGSFDAEVAVPAIDFPGEAYVSVTAAVTRSRVTTASAAAPDTAS